MKKSCQDQRAKSQCHNILTTFTVHHSTHIHTKLHQFMISNLFSFCVDKKSQKCRYTHWHTQTLL